MNYLKFAIDNARQQFADDEKYFEERDSAMTDEQRERQRERDIHDRATKLRSEMSYLDLIDALNDAGQSAITEILYAAQTYDNATLGNEISRQIQKYFRGIADMKMPEDEPIMLKNQCGG